MGDVAEFIDELATFVAFRTVVCHNREEFAAATEWIEAQVPGAHVESFDCHGLRSLLIRGPDSTQPRIVADCHMEVVAADPAMFTLTRDDDRLRGRGTVDMKTQTLAVLWAFRELLDEGATAGDVWVAITQDEEVGSRAGAAVLIQHLLDHDQLPPVAFVPDGGPDFAYVEKEKGILTVEATSRGTAAHGSRPWLGDNAIDRMTSFARACRQRWPDPVDESDWRPSVVLARLSGGSSSNRVPASATATLDVRFTEHESIEQMRAAIKELAEAHGIVVEFTSVGPATYYPVEADVAQAYLAILRDVTEREPTVVHSAGASNGRLWADAGSVHVLMSNPTGGGNHASDEWVAIDAIEPYLELVRRTFRLDTHQLCR